MSFTLKSCILVLQSVIEICLFKDNAYIFSCTCTLYSDSHECVTSDSHESLTSDLEVNINYTCSIYLACILFK